MSKLKLTDVEWGEFKIGNIFEIARGKRHIEKNRKKGNIPYYSASSVNNGVTDFISNPLFVMGNKIIVTTFCDAFYVGNTFTASDEITILDNKYINKHNGLFISNSIMSNKSKYAFGRKAFTERIKEQIIMLPIDSQGWPNWKFMEDYIKQEQKQQAQKIIDYYENKLVELAGDVIGLDKVEWKTFRFTEVFQEIQRGKRLTKANQTDGPKPYIDLDYLLNSSFNWKKMRKELKEKRLENPKIDASDLVENLFHSMIELYGNYNQFFLELNHQKLISLREKLKDLALKPVKYYVSRISKYNLKYKPESFTISPLAAFAEIAEIYMELSKIGLVNIVNKNN